MITVEAFINTIREAGSATSTELNKLLGGVDGMPITHQVGFGNAWLKNIHPNNVDVDAMNTETHVRMVAAGALTVGGVSVARKSENDFVKVLGVIGAAYGTWKLVELYADWKAGFEAAQHVGEWYEVRMGRPLFVNKV